MNSTRHFLLAAAIIFAGGLGLVCYQPRLIAQDRARLQALQAQRTALTSELQELRHHQHAHLSALSEVQQELAQLSPPLSAAPAATSAAVDAASQAWLARLQRLQTLIAQQASLGLPELQLLSQRDWLLVAKDAELDTVEHTRRSLAGLRELAKVRFMGHLNLAVRKYLAAHGSQLPLRLHDLDAYFKPPMDAAILARYEIVLTGDVSQMSIPERQRVFIREKAVVDEEYDTRSGLNANLQRPSSVL